MKFHLFNMSFESGKIPTEWKKALVVPVFKRGDKSLPMNYRPISLLCIVSKVQERIVFNKLYRFLHSILSLHQSGFRKADGTEFQLVRLVQQWSEILDASQYVGAVFFDLQKAFDKVWHSGLLAKLQATGITGRALAWFQDFLSHRCQCTLVGRAMSSELTPSAGVPQGAILSPLLFLLYVNDLPDAVSSGEANLFADDTSLFVSGKDPVALNQHLQQAINEASAWLNTWLVSVNALKSAVVLFRTRKMLPHTLAVSVDGTPIRQKSVHRHLGLHLDEHLSWSAHTSTIVNKVSSKLGLMFRLRKQLTSTVIRDVYQTCVLPVVEYGSLAWSGMGKTNAQLLDRVHRRAARLISGVKLVDNISHDLLLSRAGLTPLVAHRHFRLAQFASRFLSNSVPAHLSEALEHWRQSVPFRSMLLRRPPAVRLPRARKKILSLSPLFLALSLWNSLPPELRSSPFSVLKSHFMDLS